MSDKPDKQEKIFDATPQRLQKAREEGNVFRSKELVSVGMLVVGFGAFFGGAPIAFQAIQTLMTDILHVSAETNINHSSLTVLLRETGGRAALILLPLFGLLTIAGVGFNAVQSGWNFTLKPLQPKGNRISPAQGLKRIFSSKGIFELFKGIIKIAAVGPLVYFAISGNIESIIALPTLPIEAILATGIWWIVKLLAQMLAVLVVLTGIDFAFEKWRYKTDLKMTAREIKDEVKNSEGDPHTRARRRKEAERLSRKPRLIDAVLKSDVVITNPTHYAVAIAYDVQQDAAPRVLAKGIRKRALRIRSIALENGIAVMESPSTARALYRAVPEDAEIPADLYTAVAAILAEVYRQREKNTY